MPSGIYKHKKGYRHTEETKRKIGRANAIALKGNVPWNKGIPLTEETRMKISKAKKGKTYKEIYGTEVAEEIIRKHSIAMSGKHNPSWKGGKTMLTGGYILIKNRNHPNAHVHGYVLEHRLVMEKEIGRYLEPQEIVHHINRDRSDNKIKNLALFANNSEHAKYHKSNRKESVYADNRG